MNHTTNALPARGNSSHPVVALREQLRHAAYTASELPSIFVTLEDSARRAGVVR